MVDEMTNTRLEKLLPSPIRALYQRLIGEATCHPESIFERIGRRKYWQLSTIDLSLLTQESPRSLRSKLIPAALVEMSRTGETDTLRDLFEELEEHLKANPADRQLAEDAIEAALRAYTVRHQLHLNPNCGATLDGGRLGTTLRGLCGHRLARRPVAKFILALNFERTEVSAMWLLSIRCCLLTLSIRETTTDSRSIGLWAIDDLSELDTETRQMLELAVEVLLSEETWREMDGILSKSESNDVRAFRERIGR